MKNCKYHKNEKEYCKKKKKKKEKLKISHKLILLNLGIMLELTVLNSLLK